MTWRRILPLLSDGLLMLREVSVKDADSLHALVNSEAVRRHMTQPPPDSVEGFQRFVRWTQTQRQQGALACFAVLPVGAPKAVGLVQVWRVTPDFETAEWGIVLGETWWGRGVGRAAATLLFEFAFGNLNVQRLESRIAPENDRGRKLMTRLGAKLEGVENEQELWAVLAADRDGASLARTSRLTATGRFPVR